MGKLLQMLRFQFALAAFVILAGSVLMLSRVNPASAQTFTCGVTTVTNPDGTTSTVQQFCQSFAQVETPVANGFAGAQGALGNPGIYVNIVNNGGFTAPLVGQTVVTGRTGGPCQGWSAAALAAFGSRCNIRGTQLPPAFEPAPGQSTP
jgi:hypothetical protein